jgi:hypothetical protein
MYAPSEQMLYNIWALFEDQGGKGYELIEELRDAATRDKMTQ